VEAPDYRRLNALELLSSLLVPGSNTAEYSALRTLQSWSNWLKGHSTYANLLRHEAQLHDLRLSPNIIDARLATGTCPAWLTARRANTDALTEGTTISTLKPRKNTPTYGQSS
ncbi:metal-dependent hydrolase, partial [Rothia mucilaginosa]